ncbi:MAG TPA: biopolymer transporter ExbD, partial [Bryobacteraceae bacterium]|nr:biopolymer transporter ExbD [Bryobacteraceae bacterium]
VSMPDADKEDSVIVAVTPDGQTFLSPGLQKVQPGDLAPKVKDLLSNLPSKIVYIKADARAKYSVVEDVVDNLRAGGVDELGLLTEEIPQNTKLPPPKEGGGL